MSDVVLNWMALFAVVIIILLLVKEGIDHANCRADLDSALMHIKKQDLALDRFYNDKLEALAIADHAIDVIGEAREIVQHTIYESRLKELSKAFIDRRQREQDEKELQDEIDKLTGGTF